MSHTLKSRVYKIERLLSNKDELDSDPNISCLESTEHILDKLDVCSLQNTSAQVSNDRLNKAVAEVLFAVNRLQKVIKDLKEARVDLWENYH